MKLPEVCIRHPIFATVLSLSLIITGLISFKDLAIRYFPVFKQHRANIYVHVPGATASFMYNEVSQVIENAITGINGITKISATSSNSGSSNITVMIDSKRNYFEVIEAIRNKIASIQSQLPDMPSPPSVSDNSGVNYSIIPTLTFGFFSDELTTFQLNRYITNKVIPKLRNISGVGALPCFGQTDKVLWLWLNPIKMAQLNVTASDINNIVTANNIEINSGSIISKDKSYALVSDTLLKTPEAFANLIIRYENNEPVKIKDVADVQWGTHDLIPQQVYVNGRQGIILEVRPFALANPVAIAKKVLDVMDNIKKNFPAHIEVQNTYNQAAFIQRSINECWQAIIEAIILVMVIIFIFLGSLRMASIPVITIPVCLIASFAIMLMFNFTLNIISLLALVLATGLVVDDAIVVVENTNRHIEKGVTPFKAAIISSKELVFPIIAITLTLIVVYIPVGLSHGFTATVFREFSFTLAGAVLISGFVALTLSPMMCAYLLRPVNRSPSFALNLETYIKKINDIYISLLVCILQRKKYVLLLVIICMIVGFFIYKVTGKELIPIEDISYLQTTIKKPPSVNQSYINRNMALLDEQLRKEKYFADIVSFYISSPVNFITLKSLDKRPGAKEIVEKLSPKINNAVPGFTVSLNIPNPVDYGIGSNQFYLMLTTLNQGTNPTDLKNLADTVVKKLQRYPALQNVQSSLVYNTPEFHFTVKRDLAARLGVSLTDIQNSLNTMMGISPHITRIKAKDGYSYDVKAQLNRQYLGSFDVMSNIYVKTTTSSKNKMIPLSELITIKRQTTTPNIESYQRQRSVTIHASVVPGHSLSNIEEDVTKIVTPLLNSEQNMFYGGGIEQMNNVQTSTGFFLFLALIFIYLILAAQFESFVDPFIIMLTIPLTIVGAIFMLWLTKGTLNVYSNIGLLTLIGLVTKHGILIVQFANKLSAQNIPAIKAILQAAAIRFRPILMTSLAMIIGTLPLIISTGADSVGRFNIGVVLAGGLFLGTLFSLFIVPVAWLAFAKYRNNDVLNSMFS
ncbi:MAG: efflux RND transporter permease subunit [Endozoicomonadaceae bacterium]|nr:efflux RND transporter permease subunit [Endozoicomonadaceae bacterium]MCY4329058.1 efflux RND transporter permease subunit [Endozoicomonadaceae bacterium]